MSPLSIAHITRQICLAGLMLSSVSVFSQDLDAYRWQNRLILLFAPAPDDVRLMEQIALLGQPHTAGLADREVKVQIFSPGQGPLPDHYRRYKVRQDAFTLILVGKDGTEKFRSSSPVTAETLFEIIDAMPMRQAEMRRP